MSLDRGAIRRNFSGHAEEYDRYARVQGRVVERLVELLREEGAGNGGLCLDVGTGTGRLSRRLRETLPGVRPVLSDLAHGMTLHAARELPGLAAVDADAGRLPFAGESFSLVVSSSVYQWLDELAPAFTEVARVLRPQGRFGFALFGERSLFELKQAHRQAVGEAAAGRSSHVQDFPAEAAIRQALAAAGLQVGRLFSEEEREYHPDVPELLRALKRIGAGNASARRPPGLASRRVMQRMMAIYRERFATAEGVPATYQVIYGLARRA